MSINEKYLKDLSKMIENHNVYLEDIARFEEVLKICRPEFENKLNTNIERNKAWLRATENNILATCKLIVEG